MQVARSLTSPSCHATGYAALSLLLQRVDIDLQAVDRLQQLIDAVAGCHKAVHLALHLLLLFAVVVVVLVADIHLALEVGPTHWAFQLLEEPLQYAVCVEEMASLPLGATIKHFHLLCLLELLHAYATFHHLMFHFDFCFSRLGVTSAIGLCFFIFLLIQLFLEIFYFIGVVLL